MTEVWDFHTLRYVPQNRRKIPGGDQRFEYVPFSELSVRDQQIISRKYPHEVAWLPREEYMYPVKKNGDLAKARRNISRERSQELFDLHMVRKIMES